MKWIVPDYYADFACLMGACRHSCCIGWEIDIDEQSLQNYRSIGGAFGERLKANIAETSDGACFRMGADERCPFLNREGLCDLILELGEDALCQICADHPRFRNFFSDREEIGLGLCCEAAGRLILGRQKKASLIIWDDDGEDDMPDEEDAEILALRSRMIELMQDRNLPVEERISRMLAEMDLPIINLRTPDRIAFMLSLERLDDAWAELLQTLESDAAPSPLSSEVQETALEQLMVYLLMRHIPGVLDDNDLTGRIAFVCFIGQLLKDLFAHSSGSLEDMVEIARMYSSEIEYSDENIGRILDYLHECFPEL